MNKKKTVVLALLLVVIVALTSCLLYACNPTNAPEEPEEIEATEGLLIQNGDFKMTDQDAKDYPRSADNWSGSKMYSSSSFRDDVISGVISLDSALYAANKEAWSEDDADDELRSKLVSGGHGDDKDENKNVLMIYQPKESLDENDKAQHGPTAYGYTSASFTLDKGSYYKLSVDVLTYKITGSLDEDKNPKTTAEPGARIYVSSNTYAEFSAINTNGEWKTYEIYIETSPVSTTSLNVQLGLGKYTASYTDGLTAGYVFFDNLSLKKLVSSADHADIKDDDVANEKVANPQAAYEKALDAEQKSGGALEVAQGKTVQVTTTTLKVPNGRFDFGSLNLSSTGVPNSWTHVTGNSGKDDAAPTGLGYNAIIDTTKFADNYSKYSSNYRTKVNADDKEDLYTPADILGPPDENPQNLGFADIINSYNDRVGKSVFMLSQQLMTAQGIRSSRTITFEKGKTYALSISLLAASVRGAGVSLILSGTDGKDIVIKGIAQNKSDQTFIGGRTLTDASKGFTSAEDFGGWTMSGWTTYTFYIQSNQFKDFGYNIAIWLGTDGTSSNTAVSYRNFSQSATSTTYNANGTFSSGWLFIDELRLDEIASLPNPDETKALVDDNNTLDVSLAENSAKTGAIVDLRNADNALDNYLAPSSDETTTLPGSGVTPFGGVPQDWKSNYDFEDSNNPRIEDFVSEGIVNIASENDFASYADKLGTYPGLPYDMPSKMAYAMHASQDSYYEVETAPITIEANRFYRVSFWLKTVDVKATSGAYVYVLDKTAQAEDEENDEVILTSVTRVNTDDYDEYLNDWVEINIVVRGAIKDSTDIALKFTLGTGDRWATTTLTSGTMYVANFNMADLTYANYQGTSSSTYTKTCDLSSEFTYQFTNGSFDNYDLDDENLDESINHLYDQDVPATPESWDISDSTIVNNEDSALYAGIIQLKEDSETEEENGLYENTLFGSSHQAETATGLPAEFFENFFGDKASDSYYQNIASVSGPNLLAIGSKTAEKFAVGYASSSFTLSANTFNVLSLYARTYGPTKASIRLTGEASGSGTNSNSNFFTITSAEEAGSAWTKYVFFIKVGKNSVSLKLNLWLGEDVQFKADEDDENYEQEVENAKSAGHVFFDNISSYTLADEEKFDEAVKRETEAGSKVNQLDFNVDSFDPLSSSVESRRTLASPSGWSGAAGSNQSSSNTSAGILYTKSTNYYDSKNIDGVDYVGILGKDYTSENSDITVTNDELTEYRTNHPEAAGLTNSEVTALIVEQKITDLKVNNWLPAEQIQGKYGAPDGDHILVINNMTKSAYTYTSSSNTFKANSYYRVSVKMRTYGLNNANNDDDFKGLSAAEQEAERVKKEIGAYIELYLGSANESGNELSFKAISQDEWTTYSFYVRTFDEDVTSVTIKLSLGRYINKDVDGKSVTNGLTTGYAMFDDVAIDLIDEDIFNEAKNDESKADFNRFREVTASESGDPSDTDTNTETPKSSFNLDYLWWMIPTIVLGLVIIAVIIVLIVRKLRKLAPKSVKIKKSPTSSDSSQSVDEKHNRYDSDKD